jgi:hypothetical protein
MQLRKRRDLVLGVISLSVAVEHVELEGDLGDGLVVLTAEWEKFRRNVLEHVCTEALGLPGELDPELDDDNVVWLLLLLSPRVQAVPMARASASDTVLRCATSRRSSAVGRCSTERAAPSSSYTNCGATLSLKECTRFMSSVLKSASSSQCWSSEVVSDDTIIS